MRKEVLSWSDVDRLIHELLPQFRGVYDALLMITRGGIVPGGILSEALNINCVVLIDRLAGLRSIESFVASTPPAADSPEYFGHSYTDSQGASWQEINLQALSLSSQFLSISA